MSKLTLRFFSAENKEVNWSMNIHYKDGLNTDYPRVEVSGPLISSLYGSLLDEDITAAHKQIWPQIAGD